MAEFWDIRVRGRPLNASVARRVSEVRVTSTLDPTGDSCEVTVLGDAPDISVPDMGTIVRAAFRADREQPPVIVGEYALAETDIQIAPKRLRIKCTSMDYTGPLKDPRTAAWDDTTLGSIATAVAARYDGYAAAVDASLAGHAIAHVDQTDESDLHFLTRLGRAYDATVQVVRPGGTADILIALAPAAASASIRRGTTIPTVEITPDDHVLSGSITRTAKAEHRTVRAYYQDVDAGATIAVDVGSGEPRYRLRFARATYAEARSAAEAASARLKRETATVRLTKSGDPLLVAGNRVELRGWGDQIDTVFQITRSTHLAGSRGYTTAIGGESIPLS